MQGTRRQSGPGKVSREPCSASPPVSLPPAEEGLCLPAHPSIRHSWVPGLGAGHSRNLRRGKPGPQAAWTGGPCALPASTSGPSTELGGAQAPTCSWLALWASPGLRGQAGLSGTFLLKVCVSLLAGTWGHSQPQSPTSLCVAPSPSQRSSLPSGQSPTGFIKSSLSSLGTWCPTRAQGGEKRRAHICAT